MIDQSERTSIQRRLPVPPVVPTVRELLAAMTGEIPDQHPAEIILCAAYLLATADDWVNPDVIVSSDGDAGSLLLHTIGIADIGTGVRATLVDRIDLAASRLDNPYGRAIDTIARAWWEYQRCLRAHGAHVRLLVPGDQHELDRVNVWLPLARRAVIHACAYYRRLGRDRTWVSGPPRDEQCVLVPAARAQQMTNGWPL